MKPTPGRIILYVLNQDDVCTINARRNAASLNEDRRGNDVTAGDIVPAVVVRVWNAETGYLNAHAFLDGCDSHWLCSRSYDAEKKPGTWHWPERV